MRKERWGWRGYLLEFLSFVVGVSLAFALNNWNDNRKDRKSESKILTEIRNGLRLDLTDIQQNVQGHKMGLRACNVYQKLAQGDTVSLDSFPVFNFTLLRDFISIQNKSGYESLKSKGLEIIQNDSLRFEIITVYDYYDQILEKLEEDYSEMQFNANYFAPLNALLHPYYIFDDNGNLTGIEQPLPLSETQRKEMLSYLYRIEGNRTFILNYYGVLETKVEELIGKIEGELGE